MKFYQSYADGLKIHKYLFCQEHEGLHGYGRYPKPNCGLGWWSMLGVDRFFTDFKLELII